ncbi:hypothetical protein GCM10027037_14730 [Mucilaginibacter koreensis]
MNVYPRIEINYYPPVINASAIGQVDYSNVAVQQPVDYQTTGEVYISIFDENGARANGNNIIVSYQENFNGVFTPVSQVVIPGQSARIYVGIIHNSSFNYQAVIVGVSEASEVPSGTTSQPGICDATINRVSIDKPESDYGAADGQVSIEASSSHLPILYSLDGTNWQSSPVFTRLKGGGYTIYIQDAGGCGNSIDFTLPASHNLLQSDPTIDLGNGNTSRWSAAYNPIVFTYQRKDYELQRLEYYSDTETQLTLNGYIGTLTTNDYIYLEAGHYKGTYKVTRPADAFQVVIALPWQADMQGLSGFMNSNRLRPYYKVYTKITYQDKISGQTQSLVSTNRPDNSGLVKADLSSFLQSLLRAQDESTYTDINYRDDNLSASYTIAYAEAWDGQNDEEATRTHIGVQHPYYVIYAAKQLGDLHGGNMAAYVPFKAVINPNQLARWVTDFAEPAYSEHYPFDIGFIYSEEVAGLNLYCEIAQLDINRKPLPGGPQTTYLLNEDGSFLLNTDGSRLIISRQSIGNVSMAQHIGLNRLLISGGFAPQAAYFTLCLKYADAQGVHPVTQTQVVRIDDAVDDQSVYLRWIGLSGSWNYYRFVYNQEVTLDVQNATIIKRFVQDWERQDAIEDVISKSAGLKMKVMAEDLSVNDIKGLQAIKYSPKVQMLVGRNPIKWQTVVLNTATFAEYETRNGQAPFSVTFNLPGINIQTQ